MRVIKTGIAQKCVQVATRPPGYRHCPWSDGLSTSIQAGDDALGKMESGSTKTWRLQGLNGLGGRTENTGSLVVLNMSL